MAHEIVQDHLDYSEEHLASVADLFHVFGDLTRVRLIQSLFCCERCVQDLSESLGLSQSAVSHQLRVLRQARLVRVRREGKNMFYSLDDAHIEQIFAFAKEHVQESR